MSLHELTIYTIGHSNRSEEDVLGLLGTVGVRALVDVRRNPRSSRYPRFNQERLRQVLNGAGLVYHWAGRQLGGFRAPRPGSPHVALEGGFRGYADYMETDAFQRAAAQLVHLGLRDVTAFMCAEKDPERCHRSLIADYLTLGGARVRHQIEVGETREHCPSPQLRPESGRLVYDRGVSGALDFGD